MYLCICNAVSEMDWRSALATHNGDVAKASEATGAGTCCGCCQETLSEKACAELARPLTLTVVS